MNVVGTVGYVTSNVFFIFLLCFFVCFVYMNFESWYVGRTTNPLTHYSNRLEDAIHACVESPSILINYRSNYFFVVVDGKNHRGDIFVEYADVGKVIAYITTTYPKLELKLSIGWVDL